MSMVAHSQTDGQSEAVVKVIQKLLKSFMFQGQDLGGIAILPRIRVQWHSTIIYWSDSFLFKLRASSNRRYSAWDDR